MIQKLIMDTGQTMEDAHDIGRPSSCGSVSVSQALKSQPPGTDVSRPPSCLATID